ncbi:hypothetical protein M513_00887 [Trichuris suis]|uniref:Uncharacterized protein n=1 Tax=Trichuris suis TaxID=68888 RepID=A0A085MLM8_9BILA|nr:hypothetical protein M513_00887 [Trichuris suis]
MQNFAMYLLVQLFGETKISGSAVTRLQRTDKESDSMALKLDVDHSFVLKITMDVVMCLKICSSCFLGVVMNMLSLFHAVMEKPVIREIYAVKKDVVSPGGPR